MKQAVDFNGFVFAFQNIGRASQFSYKGKKALFDYLEECEQDCGTEIELDVIALCCEYEEDTIGYFLDQYDLNSLYELIDRTTVIFVDDLEDWQNFDRDVDGDKLVIIQNF